MIGTRLTRVTMGNLGQGVRVTITPICQKIQSNIQWHQVFKELMPLERAYDDSVRSWVTQLYL